MVMGRHHGIVEAIVIGKDINMTSSDHAIAIGSNNAVMNADNSVAIGHGLPDRIYRIKRDLSPEQKM